MKVEKQTISALELYAKELRKLADKYAVKRDKEITKIDNKFGDIEFSRDGLADAYGYGSITRAEYEKALDQMEQSADAKNVATGIKTTTSEILRMLRNDIRNIEYELAEMREE